MRRFVLGWKRLGYERRFDAHIVNYADDLVICCQGIGAQEALKAMRQIMRQLKLTVNEEKTRVCRVPEETFDFLGYTFGRCYSERTGRSYLGTRPSKKSIQRMVRAISDADRAKDGLSGCRGTMVERLNRQLQGWANYFCLGPVSKIVSGSRRYMPRSGSVGGCAISTRSAAVGIGTLPDKYLLRDAWAGLCCRR